MLGRETKESQHTLTAIFNLLRPNRRRGIHTFAHNGVGRSAYEARSRRRSLGLCAFRHGRLGLGGRWRRGG